jgi:hypothetical protein
MNDARIGSGIDDKYNLKMIQTRKEYVESILNDFGSGQISPEKLVGELTQEIKNYTHLQKPWLLMLRN